MNTNMIAKWFFDNNFLVREDESKNLIRHLTFIAAATLGIDEEVDLIDEKIKIDYVFEDYKFSDEIINLLNCINRSIGYNDYKSNTNMFNACINKFGNKKVNYQDIKSKYELFRNNVLNRFEGYNFNKRVIKVGYNIYFLNFDEELTNEELELLESDDYNQKVYEVYKEDGQVMFI